MHKCKDSGILVKYFRCENAGENKLLEKQAKNSDWKMGLDFEFTACDTPQQNHLY